MDVSYLREKLNVCIPKGHELANEKELLKEMFAEIGTDCYIEPPFHANFGGRHVHFGKNV